MRRPPSKSGFVLFDVLVAFAIAAVALTVIAATLPATTQRQAERIHRHQAAEFAYSTLEAYRVLGPALPSAGEDETGWSWLIEERSAEDSFVSGLEQMALISVSVTAWHAARPELRSTAHGLVARLQK